MKFKTKIIACYIAGVSITGAFGVLTALVNGKKSYNRGFNEGIICGNAMASITNYQHKIKETESL